MEYFESFLTTDILEPMVEETNRRAAQLLAEPGLKTSSSIKQWMDTTMNELKSFIALLLYMAIIWKPEVELHWTTNPMLEKSDVEKMVFSVDEMSSFCQQRGDCCWHR